MKYKVVVQHAAVDDLDEAVAWIARRAPATAGKWLNRFHVALKTLDANPERCPLAREDSKVDVTLREYHFGRLPVSFASSSRLTGAPFEFCASVARSVAG